MKKVLNTSFSKGCILAVFFITALIIFTPPAMAANLLAGQDIFVGDVKVKNTGTHLLVKYDTRGTGWALAETHLAVECSEDAIPQGDPGNPQIGHFEYSTPHGLVTSFTYSIPLSDLPGCNSTGNDVVIAAHAVVFDMINLETLYVLSGDGNTMVTHRRPGNALFGFADTSAEMNPPVPAVHAWEPCSAYPACDTSVNEDPSYWDSRVNAKGKYILNAGADWIWESRLVQDPVNGTVIRLERTFDIPGAPQTNSKLIVACDNGYEAFINGTSVGTSQISGDWKNSNLKQENVETRGWQKARVFDVASLLQQESNTLTVDAANEYYNRDDIYNRREGTQAINPAGCLFGLIINYALDETAWGEGIQFVEGDKSWAMYFLYTLQ
jgi:hypothetical protein